MCQLLNARTTATLTINSTKWKDPILKEQRSVAFCLGRVGRKKASLYKEVCQTTSAWLHLCRPYPARMDLHHRTQWNEATANVSCFCYEAIMFG